MTEQRTDPHAATAILAGGCFWCLEAVFLAMKGVRSVQSGYLGGHEDAPSYERVCSGDTGHAEAVKIEFDPAVVSFDALLEVFFEIHDPTTPNRQGNDIGSQYRSAIFYLSPEQEAAARAHKPTPTAAQNLRGQTVERTAEGAKEALGPAHVRAKESSGARILAGFAL